MNRLGSIFAPRVVYTSMVAEHGIQLVVSGRHDDRLAFARQWIVDNAAHGLVRVVAASQRAADDLVREASREVPGLLGVQRTTPHRLALQWATPALAAAGRTRLSALGAEALAVRAIHRVTSEAPFAYFGPVQRFAGFGRAVARTVTELRLAEVPAEALTRDAREEDLARLLVAFNDELTRVGLADTAVVLQTALQVGPPAVRAGGSPATVLIDVVPESALEHRWLDKVIMTSRASLAVNDASDPAVTGPDPTSLVERWGVTPIRATEALASDALDRARNQVFIAETSAHGPLDDSFHFFSAPGEARECVEIVRQIRDEAARGRPFDQMAVFLPRPHVYRSPMEDALRRAGIPMFSTARARRPRPSGRALLALLACASENLSAGRFAEYLSLGQVPRLTEDGSPPVEAVPWVAPRDDRQLAFATIPAPATPTAPPETDDVPAPAGHLQTPLNWERLLVDAHVRTGGADRWKRRLEGYEAELTLQLKSLADADDAARAKRSADLKSLRLLIHFSLPIVTLLEALPSEARWSSWLELLRALAGRSLREPDPVLAVLADLAPMGEVGPVGLDEVRQVLHPRLAFLAEEPSDHRFGKVFVAPIEEAAGRSFRVVFLPGLAQGVFPAPIYEDPLLLDDARAQLGADLPRGRQRRAEQRRQLRWVLGAAAERLVASYPRIDSFQGRPRVPSFYAFDLLRAALGRLPSLSSFEADAASATDSQWGWPAPRDAEAALDDGEYDLAVLGPHLHQSVDSVQGRGRYLMDNGQGEPRNPYLVRALRAEARRWRPAWTYADGLIDPDGDQRAALNKHHPTQRAYSATALQHYSECPYRFLLQAVFRLRPREPVTPVEELDPLTRGALFHEVQFHLLQRMKRAGSLSAQRLDEVRGWLDEAHTRVAALYQDRLAPSIEAVWHKAMENMRIDLHGWLVAMLRADDGWDPAHAELAFGLPDPSDADRDPASVDPPVRIFDRYLLRGAIDLVEANARTGARRVTDHKTGKAIESSLVHIGGGRHLQPLLYAMAAEVLIGQPVTAGRLSYCTRRGNYAVREVIVDDEAKAALQSVYVTLEDAFDRGFFPAAPRSGACKWCDYRRICGPFEQVRVQGKSEAELLPLERLRRRP